MLLVFQIVVALALSAAIGLGTALFTVDRGVGFEAVRFGSWSAWPRAGAADADPYTRANLSRTGDFPLAGGSGITFSANTDDEGEPLRTACIYQISGRMPSAQWWTLTIYEENTRRLIQNTPRRYAYNSSEVVRRSDGSFDIIISEKARAGNWLPIGRDAEEFRLLVRLYDTPIATGKSFQDIRMPGIRKLECAS